jgi:hypothetical protein
MLGEGFSDSADAALRAERNRRSEPGARNYSEIIVDPRKAFGGKRALPPCHGLEDDVESEAEVDSARDAAKPDDLGSNRKRCQELGALNWFSLLRQRR